MIPSQDIQKLAQQAVLTRSYTANDPVPLSLDSLTRIHRVTNAQNRDTLLQCNQIQVKTKNGTAFYAAKHKMLDTFEITQLRSIEDKEKSWVADDDTIPAMPPNKIFRALFAMSNFYTKTADSAGVTLPPKMTVAELVSIHGQVQDYLQKTAEESAAAQQPQQPNPADTAKFTFSGLARGLWHWLCWAATAAWSFFRSPSPDNLDTASPAASPYSAQSFSGSQSSSTTEAEAEAEAAINNPYAKAYVNELGWIMPKISQSAVEKINTAFHDAPTIEQGLTNLMANLTPNQHQGQDNSPPALMQKLITAVSQNENIFQSVKELLNCIATPSMTSSKEDAYLMLAIPAVFLKSKNFTTFNSPLTVPRSLKYAAIKKREVDASYDNPSSNQPSTGPARS